MYYCCGLTDKGIMPHNEDALLIGKSVIDSGTTEQELGAPFIAAVSDGVSGELSGEVASKMCLEMISELHYTSRTDLSGELLSIHSRLAQFSNENPDNRNMQATLCGIAVDERGNILTFNVGDSRLYRFRSGRITQISRDQSLVQLLYEEGSITLAERKTHVHRNIIFPAFGNVSTRPKIDISPITGGTEFGDVLILCSDGLSDYVSPIDMEEIMELPRSLPERLQLLLEKASANESKDNITVAAIVCC